MTVQELIDALSKFPPDLMVVRSGYEGGVTEVDCADIERIKLNVNEEWYYGPHELLDADENQEDYDDGMEAIYVR